MGLKGVPGLRVSKTKSSTRGPSKGAIRNQDNDDNSDRLKRTRHQGTPDILSTSTGVNDDGFSGQGDHIWSGRIGGSRGHGMRVPSSGGSRGGRWYGKTSKLHKEGWTEER